MARRVDRNMTQPQPLLLPEHQYRYERKFLIAGLNTKQLILLIHLHPMAFVAAYPDRSVNNIYFDTEDFLYFRDNVEGVSNRKKIRIRWYGELADSNVSPVLEYKIKRGPVGYKKSYPLGPFKASSTNFNVTTMLDQMLDCNIPESVRLDLASHRPVLLNSYERKYYVSRDGRYRVTIDNKMTFYRVKPSAGTLLCRQIDFLNTVIELKYSMMEDNDARSVSNSFPFRMTKNSKYVTGVSRMFGGRSF